MAWEKTGVCSHPKTSPADCRKTFWWLISNHHGTHRWTTSSAIPDYGKTGCRVNSTVVKPENEKIERAENKLSCTVTLLLVRPEVPFNAGTELPTSGCKEELAAVWPSFSVCNPPADNFSA